MTYSSCMQCVVINCAKKIKIWMSAWLLSGVYLCTPLWYMFSSVYSCCTAMWGNMTCMALRYVTLWQSAYGLWQRVCMRCTSWPLVFLFNSLALSHRLRSSFPIMGCHPSPSPPDPISCFIRRLSNYLHLTPRPSGQHGWLVFCQLSKWGIAGISWSFY